MKRPSIGLNLRRLHVALRRVALAPSFSVLKPAAGPGPWVLYFVYSPDGRAWDQHRFTMARLREQGFRILVVIACDASPAEEFLAADAVIRKGLRGFDFSGYAIGLDHLADTVGPTDVLVMNDSVFGPFADLRSFLDRTPWRLTGFTANYGSELHLQSYALMIRDFDRAYMDGLRSILWRRFASSHYGGVVFLQETRLARVAARIGSVGAVWLPDDPAYELSIADPLGLIAAGHPFLKRFVIGKFASWYDQDTMMDALARLGHPTDPATLMAH